MVHLEPLLPRAKPSGRPRGVNLRRILNGIFYLLRSVFAWRLLPRALSHPKSSAYRMSRMTHHLMLSSRRNRRVSETNVASYHKITRGLAERQCSTPTMRETRAYFITISGVTTVLRKIKP
jgi:transposase